MVRRDLRQLTEEMLLGSSLQNRGVFNPAAVRRLVDQHMKGEHDHHHRLWSLLMFETWARLGTRDDRLRKFGYLLGTLYHGCDDVADVRGTAALGGGKKEDVVDGILTLPAAIATRDPKTALLFRNASIENAAEITNQLMLALPEAENYLDGIAAEAEREAHANARFPERLIALVQHTRALSQS